MYPPTAPRATARPFSNRLVATWAAFFARLGWQVEHEPFVLNGWYPTFAIHGAAHTTLAEVRPMVSLSPIVAANALGAANWVPIYPSLADSPKAIEHSILLLGVSPLCPLTSGSAPARADRASLGWLYDGADAAGVYEGGNGEWQTAYLLRLPQVHDGLGFSGLFGNWSDRISGQHFNMMTDDVVCAGRSEIETLWAESEAEAAVLT